MDRKLEMKFLLVVMTVLVVSSAREWKSGGYNSGYYWDRGCDFFPSEGYDLSPFATLREPWECAERCVNNPSCTHFHHDFDNDQQKYLCYHKRNTGYKAEVSKYSGATCGWIPGRSNYDLHYTDNRRAWPSYENGDGGVKFREACDFQNAEVVGNEKMPMSKCGRSCINHKGCNAFSYSSGRCFLKNVPQPFIRTDTTFNSICGFLPWQFPGDDVQSEDDEHTSIHCPGETENREKMTYKEIELPFGSRFVAVYEKVREGRQFLNVKRNRWYYLIGKDRDESNLPSRRPIDEIIDRINIDSCTSFEKTNGATKVRNANYHLDLQKLNVERIPNRALAGRKWCNYRIYQLSSAGEKTTSKCPTPVAEIHLLADTMFTVRHVREAFEDALHMNEVVWLSAQNKNQYSIGGSEELTDLEK